MAAIYHVCYNSFVQYNNNNNNNNNNTRAAVVKNLHLLHTLYIIITVRYTVHAVRNIIRYGTV